MLNRIFNRIVDLPKIGRFDAETLHSTIIILAIYQLLLTASNLPKHVLKVAPQVSQYFGQIMTSSSSSGVTMETLICFRERSRLNRWAQSVAALDSINPISGLHRHSEVGRATKAYTLWEPELRRSLKCTVQLFTY